MKYVNNNALILEIIFDFDRGIENLILDLSNDPLLFNVCQVLISMEIIVI